MQLNGARVMDNDAPIYWLAPAFATTTIWSVVVTVTGLVTMLIGGIAFGVNPQDSADFAL